MSNPIMGGRPQNPMAMLAQIKQNPMALLQRAGFSVPQNITNPQDIIQHLMNSGQVSQSQINQAMSKAKMLGLM